LLQRDALWKAAPYPCVGYASYQTSNVRRARDYKTILQRAKEGATVLDLGTCVGQELRVLVNDGAPSDNMYGAGTLLLLSTYLLLLTAPLGRHLQRILADRLRPFSRRIFLQSDLYPVRHL
jgi:hypothetical protein